MIPAVRSSALGLSAALVLAVTACSGVAGNARLADAEASGDGTLRIGVILDSSGEQSFLNDAQQAAVELAVRDVNADGGHKGKPVELLATPSGDSASQARKLVDGKADVVVGPTDSVNAPAAIDVLSRAGITVISPANTASALTNYKSGGYYFRTAAADAAQAPVLVKLATDTGAKSLAVIYQEGSYGKAVSDAVASVAGESGLGAPVVAEFAPGQAADAAAKVRDAAADAVVVIAREGSQGVLAELKNAGIPGEKLLLSDGAFDQYGSGLANGTLEGARAVLPGNFPSSAFQDRLLSVDKGLKDLTFAAESYDAVILAALAAEERKDDSGKSIAAGLISVSGGHIDGAGERTPCTSFVDCRKLLASGKGADYDGQSGPVAFDGNGDITSASYMTFTYGPDNKATLSGKESAARSNG